MLASLKNRVNQEILISIDDIDFDSNLSKPVSKKFRIEIDFEIRESLIYYNDNNIIRLWISRAQEEKIFRLTHDENQHAETHRCFYRISETFFISRLLKKIRIYVKHCSAYQINQIKRHFSYDELISISTTSRSFHIIAMNFIVELLDKYDCLLTITNKFSRWLFLISRYIIEFAATWDRKMLRQLQFSNWDIFEAIIFDRDSKFISNFWQEIFKQLEISLLTSTTYHSQIDDLSKRFNQIVKIVIKYLIICYSDLDW